MSKVKELRDELIKDLCTTYAHPFFKEEAEAMIDALIQEVREEEFEKSQATRIIGRFGRFTCTYQSEGGKCDICPAKGTRYCSTTYRS